MAPPKAAKNMELPAHREFNNRWHKHLREEELMLLPSIASVACAAAGDGGGGQNTAHYEAARWILYDDHPIRLERNKEALYGRFARMTRTS